MPTRGSALSGVDATALQIAIAPHESLLRTTIQRFLRHRLAIVGTVMGLETSIGKLTAKGLRPALLGAFAFLLIAGFSLTLIELMG